MSRNSELLLVSEQGLGDTLQFMRYAFSLRDQGAEVSLCAPAWLHSLIKTSGLDNAPLTPQEANSITEGLWIPLMSVARHLEVNPCNPIITEPYIKSSEQLISKWQSILTEAKRPIICINWQGNPNQEKTNSIGRSLPLETFAPIAQQTDLSLLSHVPEWRWGLEGDTTFWYPSMRLFRQREGGTGMTCCNESPKHCRRCFQESPLLGETPAANTLQ